MTVAFLQIVGDPRRSIFGLQSDQALQRQITLLGDLPKDVMLVAAADVAMPSPTLRWLVDHPGAVLVDDCGGALVGAVRVADADALARSVAARRSPPAGLETVADGETTFVRALRRRERLEVIDLATTSTRAAERSLFERVYKGVTDAVTKFVWPIPAFHLVRLLARLHVTPNAVTMVGIALVMVAAACFARGDWAVGLVAAWVMTFLDTVDGKLARVTHTSSRIGDILDHGTDWVHPPIWWACVAWGLERSGALESSWCWNACIVIVVGYFAGRASEGLFKLRFGFNQYIWQPFDAALRLVIARRNPNLVILTFGALLGQFGWAFVLVAVWTILTIGVQLVRLASAYRARAARQDVCSYLTAT